MRNPHLPTAHFLLPTAFPRQRDLHLKYGTLTRLALGGDRPPVGFGDPLSDGQSQTRASGLARARRVGAKEAFEDVGEVLGSNADAAIAYLRDSRPVTRAQRDLNAALGRCILHGVVEQNYEQPEQRV